MSLKKATEQKYLESSNYQRKVEKANEKLAFKPFSQLYQTIEKLAKIAQFLLPLLSITFAVSFVMTWFSFLNIYLSFVLALALLIFIESIKSNALNTAWSMHYANLGSPMVLGVFAVFISVVSFVTSYNGAETLVQKLSDKKELITSNTNTAKDSIKNVYNTQIANNIKAIDSIKTVAKKQWHGLTSKEQNLQINQYLSTNLDLSKSLRSELSELKENKQESLKESKAQTFYSAYWSKLLAAFIEVALLLAIWFTNFYDYKTVQENIDLVEMNTIYKASNQTEIAPIKTNLVEIAAQKVSAGDLPMSEPAPEKQIGFTAIYDKNKNAVPTAYAAHTGNLNTESIMYLQKHKQLVKAIKKHFPNGTEVLSNSAIKDIKNVLTSVKYKSDSLIRKVFVAMQSVGFDRIDNNGKIINK